MRAKDIKPGKTVYVSHCDVEARPDWRPCVKDGVFAADYAAVADEVCPVYRDPKSQQLIVEVPEDYPIAKSNEAGRKPHDFVTVTLHVGTSDKRHSTVPEKLQHSRK